MKFVNIRVFDSDLNFIKEVSNFRTLMYHSRWEDIGDFELHLDNPLPKIFQNGYYIMVNNDPRLTGVIEYEFNNGDAFLPDASKDFTIKGYSLLSLINRRISVPPTDGDGYRRWSGTAAETIIYNLVNENCINPTDTKRIIEHLECATDQKRGKTITTSTRYDNLTTFINTICKQSELGVAVELDAVNKKFVFKVLEGTDRCYSSTNPNSFIFSKKFGRVVSQTSEHSTLGTANMAYVLGEGDGKDRKCVEIIKGNNGLRRRELYVDARDIANKSDDDPTYDAVLNLENRGDEKLAEVAETYSFEFEAGTREYRTAWNLGDKCTFRADDENVTQENIITEVTETWEGGKYTIEPVAGHTKTTILSTIQSAANSAVVERAGISQQFDEISANFIKVTQLIAKKVDVSDLTAYEATVAQLVAGKADVDMLNVNDASITSAKIKDVSADKIAAGTIDASVIKVINLSAENITVGKINGQQIADAAITSAKISNVDAGKITSGYISADRIQAGTVTISKLATDASSAISTAQSTASTAQTTASNAASAASTAQTKANSAASAASTAQQSADSAASAASAAQSTANSASTAATKANNKIASWCAANDTTLIDGGKIYTGSVTADKINANSLSAISANLGTVTAGTLQSANYSESAVISWDPLYSGDTVTNGMKINLTTGTISTPHLMMDENGVLKINGELYSIGSPSVIQVKSGGLQLLDGYDETHPQVGKIAVVAKTSGSTTTNCFDISTGSYDAYIESKNLHIVSTGKTSTNGELDVGGNLGVDGSATAASLSVTGSATAASLSVTGATTSGTGSITGALSVGGKITNGTTFVPKFYCGSTVVNLGGGSSLPVFSISGLNTTFGVTNVSSQNTVVFFANGDGGASAAHTTGATFLNSDSRWYVTTDRNVPGLMRINYMVVYFG